MNVTSTQSAFDEINETSKALLQRLEVASEVQNAALSDGEMHVAEGVITLGRC